MTIFALISALALQDEALAEARARAVEARNEAENRVGLIPGVRSVGMGGAGIEFRVLIVVDSLEAKAKARQAIGGDLVERVPVVWSIRPVAAAVEAPPAAAPPPPAQALPVPPPAAEIGLRAADNFWKARPEDCDIIRDHLRMKSVSRPAGNGRYWRPCAVHLRQVVGVAGGHTFTYTKHRPDCPIRLGRVGMPAESDRFITWVYTSGYTYPIRAGFFWPTELRGSDSLWIQQAYGDLASRTGYIRSGGSQAPGGVVTGR
jgi:hypothetical protein